ncbi:MAG: hypothetical protein WC420_02190 [Candidatus Paceibacterota bacterium]
MLIAKYPIKDTSEFITVTIDTPEDLPPNNKRVSWSICAPGFEKHDHSCGIDDLQCLLLSMQSIIRIIEEWEKNTGNKCEYTFYQDVKIIYDPEFLKEKKLK